LCAYYYKYLSFFGAIPAGFELGLPFRGNRRRKKNEDIIEEYLATGGIPVPEMQQVVLHRIGRPRFTGVRRRLSVWM